MGKGFLAVVFLSVLLLMPACKGNESSSAPPVTPTAQGIVVTSNSDMMYIGASETFAATASMSDGANKTVTGGSWGGDNPSVATVEASTGRVTIVGSGNVNIFVDYGGKRGSKAIRGLPNYQGTWKGTYIVVSCSATGDFARTNFCADWNTGKVMPCTFNLTQDRDAVSGRFYLGTLGADASGPVQGDGQLRLVGAVKEGSWTIEVQWALQSRTQGNMTGALSQLWRYLYYSGDGRVYANINNMVPTGLNPPSEIQLRDPRLTDIIRAMNFR